MTSSTEIHYGDYVEVPSKPGLLPLIGRVMTVWGEWATVSIPIGGARKMISYRLDELTRIGGNTR